MKLKNIILSLCLIGAGLYGQNVSQPQPVGNVGPRSVSDGMPTGERFGRDNAQVTQEGHGRYQENTLRGNTYQACNQAGTAMPNALSATATGFILSNPAGSGYNIVLLELIVAPSTIAAAPNTLVLAGNNNTAAAAVVHTTPLTVRSALLGQTRTGVGLADGAATLPASPVVVRAIPGGNVIAAAGATSFPPFIKDEIAGALALQPGTSVSTFSLTTASSAIVCMTWEEVQL